MFVVDTNVLLYARNEAAPEHDRCLAKLEGWRRQTAPWYLTWGIVYEFLRVSTHPRVFERPISAPEAWGFVGTVLEAPGVTVLAATDRHREVVHELITGTPGLAGNVMHDLHTAALMREHGIATIVTRDTDFHRFPFLEVRDPLR